MSRRRKRSEAQEVDTLRRWIYRAFARELYKWMAAYAPCSIPMNPRLRAGGVSQICEL